MIKWLDVLIMYNGETRMALCQQSMNYWKYIMIVPPKATEKYVVVIPCVGDSLNIMKFDTLAEAKAAAELLV